MDNKEFHEKMRAGLAEKFDQLKKEIEGKSPEERDEILLKNGIYFRKIEDMTPEEYAFEKWFHEAVLGREWPRP